MPMANDEEYRTADAFVSGEETVPHPVKGAIPVYDDGVPPDTILPATRCPCCDELMPSLLDIWKARQNRDRLAERREQYDFGTGKWEGYNEGVHHYRKEIARLLGALPANVSSWASRVTDPRRPPYVFDPETQANSEVVTDENL
jgi:hypothetical protein